MIVRAPGKVVISGAYAVLEGAPALVAAVDRYVTADASREASYVTEEVRAAIDAGSLARAPCFDASALRVALADGTSRKLGLGSSAAILVASIGAAIAADFDEDEEGLRAAVEALALSAHRAAQPGGSGIDVAASVRGGVVACRRAQDGALETSSHTLPKGLVIQVFQSPVSASTPRLIAAVRAYEAADRAGYRARIDGLTRGSERALDAASASEFIEAIRDQIDELARLGAASGASIVTTEVASLRSFAAHEDASFGPSGAGGGDVALFIGLAPPSAHFVARAAEVGLTPLDATVDARGLHVLA